MQRSSAIDAGLAAPRRTIHALWICILAAVFAIVTVAPADANGSKTRRYAGMIVIDAETGEALRAINSRKKRQPASLVKMMTLYLTFEALENGDLKPDQSLVTSRRAADMPPSELGLKRGDRITVREAIRASAIRSANDAAVVLAEAVAGTEAAFARRMTAKAKELGMRDTSFANASGLTRSGNLSTPRDMAKLARALRQDFPEYYHLFGKRNVRIQGRTYRNTNRLLGVVDGVDGLKTGYTRAAQFNLAASATRDGRQVIAVVFGGVSRQARDAEVAALLGDGFRILKKRGDRKPPRVDAPLVAERPLPRPTTVASASARAEVVASAGPAMEVRPVRRPERETVTLAATRRTTVAGPGAAAEQSTSARSGAGPTGWGVQVGAFSAESAAKRQLDAVLRRYGAALRSGAPQIATTDLEKPGRSEAKRLFRARVLGMTSADARKACRSLKKNGDVCALIPPTGWR